MSLAYYDAALYKKIHDLFDNVVNADDNSAFDEAVYSNADTQENASKKKPKITLPLISFWRTGNPPNLEQDGNYPAILKGKFYDRQGSTPKSFRTFPVNISYQITIWSDTRREVDEIYREFVMLFFVDEPWLRVTVANENYKTDDGEESKFLVDEEFSLILTDSSTEIDTSTFSDRGRVYRQDIMIEIPNAKMFYFGKEKSSIRNGLLAPNIELSAEKLEKL